MNPGQSPLTSRSPFPAIPAWVARGDRAGEAGEVGDHRWVAVIALERLGKWAITGGPRRSCWGGWGSGRSPVGRGDRAGEAGEVGDF